MVYLYMDILCFVHAVTLAPVYAMVIDNSDIIYNYIRITVPATHILIVCRIFILQQCTT